MKIIKFILTIASVFAFAFVINTYVVERAVVNGDSMNNTLEANDNVIVSKISYHLGDPERFDVVVFSSDETQGDMYIKRVIGLPGETVSISGGEVYINGKKLDGDIYGNTSIQSSGVARRGIKLKDNEYFVLGDNRNNSTDSRIIGAVNRDDLVGKVLLRIFPFTKVNTL